MYAIRSYYVKVTVGAWLDKDLDYNKKEIEAAIEATNRNPNVRGVIVGNETLLRADLTYDQLVSYLRQVRKRVGVPVSTGEIWYSWIEHPKLANEVDFIAAHVLPYWEAVPPEDAVKFAVQRYQDLKNAFPGKRIVIAEFVITSYSIHYTKLYERMWVPSPVAWAQERKPIQTNR